MCGIAGFFGSGDSTDLQAMMQAITHRGPDGSGDFKADDLPLYLGHLRLSILDLAGGHQPMSNADHSIWVTYNGEIYNHLELRAELEAKGYKFQTDHSDTEVLVHGWQEWGKELAAKLNGMFAFCVFDKTKQSLFLARDRFGEKPLFWAKQGDLFSFASEITAIAAHRHFKAEVNKAALKKFFAYNYIPSPSSILQDCHKLKPGHSLSVDLKTGEISQDCYWQYRIEVASRPPSLNEAAEEVQKLLVQSTKRRLMSDVPLGVFLSGGVDSSAVAAAMCQLMPVGNVKSFSIGFQEKSFDESGYARSMAEFLGTDHHEKILDFGSARELVPHVMQQLDEPMGDGSLLPTYLLCQFAREKVTVALSGDAGDEIFAGYDPFRALKMASLYEKIMPSFAHKGMKCLIDLLPKSTKNMSLDFKLRRVLMGLDYGPEVWNPVWMSALSLNDVKDLFAEPVSLDELYGEAIELWQESFDKSLVDKTQEFFTNFYLPDDILTKVDRAAMLNGLEARSVFLDNDLVDFARSLPAEYKFDGSTTKKVLKLALARMVPQEILDRPKKGFGIPLMEWLRDFDLSGDVPAALPLQGQKIQAFTKAHQSAQADHRFFLWNMMLLRHSSLLKG